MADEMYTVAQAATYLGVTEADIRLLIRDNKLRGWVMPLDITAIKARLGEVHPYFSADMGAILRDDTYALIAEVEALRARLAALEEGLRPFAAMADWVHENHVPDKYITWEWGHIALTAGDIRQAYALLQPAQESAGQGAVEGEGVGL